mmetsp:Transcript_23255/g.50252  ORF Transcript_23255/g.50252 Transcript_23255/m.50252 type:complete len:430 (-) Transcript_23255:1176-2465(-)
MKMGDFNTDPFDDPFNNSNFFDAQFGNSNDDGDDARFDDNESLSKFENFLQRKSKPTATTSKRGGNGNGRGGSALSNCISPKSEDGMSFVSRMKHNNYANVVQEMKLSQKNKGRQLLQQQQQQHGGVGSGNSSSSGGRQEQQQRQRGLAQQQWGFDSDPFGDNIISQQPIDPPQQQPQQPQQQQPPLHHQQQQHQQLHNHARQRPKGTAMGAVQRLTPPRNNRQRMQPPTSNAHSNVNPNNNPSNATATNANSSGTTRAGRKLYQDPSQSTKTPRSRSTVRRTADRTQRLALAYKESRSRRDSGGSGGSHCDVGDGMSDVGSVFSNFGGGGGSGGYGLGEGYCLSGSGSVSGESLGFPMQQQQQPQYQQQQHQQQSNHSIARQNSNRQNSNNSKSGIDSFMSRTASDSTANNSTGDGDNVSVLEHCEPP